MKRPFQTLPWGHMKKSMLRFGVLISLFAGLMQLSCKNDDRQELFELNFPPPPIEFDILPGLNTFDTHIYSFSPIPVSYTHLDVYKRQNQRAALATSSRTVGPEGSTLFSIRRCGLPLSLMP